MNEAQREHWNSTEVLHWVTAQDRFDRQLQPFADAVIEAAAIEPTERVLDIGCGCGATTIAVAGMAASALGVDISEQMLARARERATEVGVANAEFVVADAQSHQFEPASFDLAISRFGVMFFDDPVKAFANIGSALRPGGRIAFVCWRDLAANEWLLTPGMAAAAHVGPPAPGPPGTPGMFALADADLVRRTFGEAGFTDVDLVPFDTPMLLAGGGTVDDAVEFLLSTGIAKAMFAGADPVATAAAIEAVRNVLTPYLDTDGVRLGAGTWLVTARRP